MRISFTLMIMLALMLGPMVAQTQEPERWRGLVVADEHRCTDYSSSNYRHSQKHEKVIIERMGGYVYGPYSGRIFAGPSDTDIEHIVAKSEAHDSGLCARDAAEQKAFGNDLLNMTLADPYLNRREKSNKDAAEWLPEINKCWFANRVVEVRQKYQLTIDRAEAAALEKILQDCNFSLTPLYIKLPQHPAQ